MQLADFPEAIAASARELLEAQQVARTLQAELARFTAGVEAAIAFDDSLKNDAQRKAKRAELMDDPKYQFAVTALEVGKDAIAVAEIDHQLLLNQFTVAKLQARETIASLERHTL